MANGLVRIALGVIYLADNTVTFADQNLFVDRAGYGFFRGGSACRNTQFRGMYPPSSTCALPASELEAGFQPTATRTTSEIDQTLCLPRRITKPFKDFQ